MNVVNHSILRDINTGLIMRMIAEQAPISRSEIADKSGLAPSTITNIVSELQHRGLVRTCGRASSSGGRPPILLEINPTGGYFIAVELNTPTSEIGVLDLSNTMVHWLRYETMVARAEATYQQLVERIREAIDGCRELRMPLLGIGISVTGLVDTYSGAIIESTNLNWDNFPLLERLGTEFGSMPILVENEANAATFGEYVCASKVFDMKNAMYVAVGSGIGCGIIVDGALYTGTYGVAGEIGHITLNPEGPRCRCGKFGCLEVFASGVAISDAYRAVTSRSIPAYDVVFRAEGGDADAIEILSSAGRYIGTAIGNQVNILNLDTVMLGGELLFSESVFFQGICSAARSATIPALREGVTIRLSSLKSHSAVVGAATLLWHRIFA